MHRIIVVDDERHITDAIYYLLLRQEQWDIEVFRTYDGNSAWALMERSCFDLLISDICMPGLDGLILAQKVRELWPNCKIIFLTGYENFEHAFLALQLGGVRYILKTSDFSKLLDEVGQALETLRVEQERSRRQTRLEAQVAMAFSMFRNDMCVHLLRGRTPSVSWMRESGFDIDVAREMLLLVMCFSESDKQSLPSSFDHSAKLFIHAMHRLLVARQVRWFYGMLEDALICLFQPAFCETSEKQSLQTLNNLIWEELSEIQSLIEQETNRIPILLMSRDSTDVAGLPLLFSEMEHFAAHSSAQGAIMHISARQPTIDVEGAVCHAIRQIYLRYAEDISLLSLANAVHMNTTYFSRLFKKETGKNFVDFVNSVRIEAACQLLRDTFLKVADIAVATGFGTPKYFHVVFKRYMGVTPVQWREQQMK